MQGMGAVWVQMYRRTTFHVYKSVEIQTSLALTALNEGETNLMVCAVNSSRLKLFIYIYISIKDVVLANFQPGLSFPTLF